MDTEAHTASEVKSVKTSKDDEKVSMSNQFDRNASDFSCDKLIKPNNESIQGTKNHECSTENENEQSSQGEEVNISAIISTSSRIPDEDTCKELPSLDKSNRAETCPPVTEKTEEGEKHQRVENMENLGTGTKKNEALQDLTEEMGRSQYIELSQNEELTSLKQGHGAEVCGGTDVEPTGGHISIYQAISVESNDIVDYVPETVSDVMTDGAMGMFQSCTQNVKIDNISSTSTTHLKEEYEETSSVNVEKAERTFESVDDEKSPEMTRSSEVVENKSNGNGEASIPAVQETPEAHDNQDNPKVAPEIQNSTEGRLESPPHEIEISELTKASGLEVDDTLSYSNVSYERKQYKEETSVGSLTPIEKLNEAGTSAGPTKEEDRAAEKDVSTATEDREIQFLENALCTEISLLQKIEQSEETPDILEHTESKEREKAASGEKNDVSVIVKKSKQNTEEDREQNGKGNEETSISDDHNLVPIKQLLEVHTREKTDSGDMEIQCHDRKKTSMETHEPLIADEGNEKLKEITHEIFESTDDKKPDNTNTEGTSEETISAEVPGIMPIIGETFDQRFKERGFKDDGEILVDEEKCCSRENDFRTDDMEAQKVTEEGRIEEEEKTEGSIMETMETSHTVEIKRKTLVEDIEESSTQGYEHISEKGNLVEENRDDTTSVNKSEVNDDKLSKTAEKDQTNQLLKSLERRKHLEEMHEVISDINNSNAINEHSEFITGVEGEETILNHQEIVDVHKKEENATDSNEITDKKTTETEVCAGPKTEIRSLNGENQEQDETTDVKLTKPLVKEEEEQLLKCETEEKVTLTRIESNDEVLDEDMLEEKVTESFDHITLKEEETQAEKKGQDSDSNFGKGSLATANNDLSDRVNIEKQIDGKSKFEEHENSDIPDVTVEGSEHLNNDIEEKVHGGSKKKSLDIEEEHIQTEKKGLILDEETTKPLEVLPKKDREEIEDAGQRENLVQQKIRGKNDDIHSPTANTEDQNEANQIDLAFKSHSTTAEYIQEAESSQNKDNLDTNNFVLEAKIETSSFAYLASKEEFEAASFSIDCQRTNDSEHISAISTIGGEIMQDVQSETRKQVQDSDTSLDLDGTDKEERKSESHNLVIGNDKTSDKDEGGETIEMINEDGDATSADRHGTEKTNGVICAPEHEVHDSVLSLDKQDPITTVRGTQVETPTRKENLHTDEETPDFTLLNENVLQEQEFVRHTDVSNLQKTDSTEGDTKEEMENWEGKSSRMAVIEDNDENINDNEGSKIRINEKEADNTSYIADNDESDYGCKMVIIGQKSPSTNLEEVSTGARAPVDEATIESVDEGLSSRLEDTSIQNDEAVTPKNVEPADTTKEFEVAGESATKDQTDENQPRDNVNSNSYDDEITESVEENGEKVHGETERLIDLQLNLEHHIEEGEKPRPGEELKEHILKKASGTKEVHMISDGTDKEIEFVKEFEAKNFSEIERSKNLEELISSGEGLSNLAAKKVLPEGASTEERKRTLSESFNLENHVDEDNIKAETFEGKLGCGETSLNETKKENKQVKYSVAPQEEEETRIQTEGIRSEIVENEERKEKSSNSIDEKEIYKIYGEGREEVDEVTGDKGTPPVGYENVLNNLTPTSECHVQKYTAMQPEGVKVTSTLINSIKESGTREEISCDIEADHVVGFLSRDEIQGRMKSTIEEEEHAHEQFKRGEDEKITPQVMSDRLGDKNSFTDSSVDETESELKKQTRRESAEDEPSKSSTDHEDPIFIHRDSEKETKVKELEIRSENSGISEHALHVVTIKEASSLMINTENKEQVIEVNDPDLAANMVTMTIEDQATSPDSTNVNEIQEDDSSLNISEGGQLQDKADASKDHNIHDEDAVTENEHARAVADLVPMSANEFPHSSRLPSTKEEFGTTAPISAKDEAFPMEGVISDETEGSFLLQKESAGMQKEPEHLSKLEQGEIMHADMIERIQCLQNTDQAETTEKMELTSESISEAHLQDNISHEESNNTEAQRSETSKPVSGEKLLGESETETHFQFNNVDHHLKISGDMSIKHEHHENIETSTTEPYTVSTGDQADNKMGYLRQFEATNLTDEERSKTLEKFADPKQYLIALTAAEVFKEKCTGKDKNSISHNSNIMPSLPEKETRDETFHERNDVEMPEKSVKGTLLDETAEENKVEQKYDVKMVPEDATVSGKEGTSIHIVNTEGIKQDTSNLVEVKNIHETIHKEKEVADEDTGIHISAAGVSHGEVHIGLIATPKDLLQDSARTERKGEPMANEMGNGTDNSKTRDEAASIDAGESSEVHTTDQTLIEQKEAIVEAEGLSRIENKDLEKGTKEEIEMLENTYLHVEHVLDDTITKEKDISTTERGFNLEDQTDAYISDILRYVKTFKAGSAHDPGNSLGHDESPTLEEESELAESMKGSFAAAVMKEATELGAISHEHDSTDIKENELLTEKKFSSAYPREDVELAVESKAEEETKKEVLTMNEIGTNNLLLEENFQDELKREMEPKLDGQDDTEVQANEKETRIIDICAEEEREFKRNESKDYGSERLKEEIVGSEINFTDIHVIPETNEAANEAKETVPDSKEDIEATNSSDQTTHLSTDVGHDQLKDKTKSATEVVGEQNEDDLRIIDNSAAGYEPTIEEKHEKMTQYRGNDCLVVSETESSMEKDQLNSSPLDTTSLTQESQEVVISESNDQRNAAIATSLLAEDADAHYLQGIKTAPLVAMMAEYSTIEEINGIESENSKQHLEGLDADNVKDIREASAAILNLRSAKIEAMCEDKATTDQSLSNDTFTKSCSKQLVHETTTVPEKTEEQKRETVLLIDNGSMDNMAATNISEESHSQKEKSRDLNLFDVYGGTEEENLVEVCKVKNADSNFSLKPHGVAEKGSMPEARNPTDNSLNFKTSELLEGYIHEVLTSEDAKEENHVQTETETTTDLKTDKQEEAGVIERSTCFSEVPATQGTGNIHNHGDRLGLKHACEEAELKDAASDDAATQEHTRETKLIKKGEEHGLNRGKAGAHEGVGAILGEMQILAASHEDKETDVSAETEDETKTIQLYDQVEDVDDGQGNAKRNSKSDTDQEAPVTVEAFKDSDVKVAHKKSHNILSGVGSKVKHSISKVKKALVGKSSHSHQKATTSI